MSIAPELLIKIVEAALMAAAKPLSINQLQALFDENEKPAKSEIEAAFEDIQNDLADRGFELIEVANGWRFQVKQDLSAWVGRLWEEKPQKYSRAMLETLALVAYRQPITRGEIEQIRGVAVSSHIMKTLMERNWVKVIGHRDVPGRPSMYATTKEFLDYFSLSSLEYLPTLAEIRDLDSLNEELNLEAANHNDNVATPESNAPNINSESPDSESPGNESLDVESLENETLSESAIEETGIPEETMGLVFDADDNNDEDKSSDEADYVMQGNESIE